ncbi:ketohexokinase [Trichonephila clavata]|uniref:Ketohexokinase n=1 Tax=Trichonephila clavata TaxID=2740835 RepID=A0A8X6JIR3_TRICU|nr:ketohexokinase [Trichonephila clavata]
MGKKVLCVGLCCLDLVMYCESYPIEDSDQRSLSHSWQRGGNASNNCSVFAEFGIPVEILGTMSNDIGGQFMKKDFEQCGICFENCHFYEEYESPVSSDWINVQNGSRTIMFSNKNMPEVSFEDFKCLDLNNYSWIHFECRPYFEEMKKMIQLIRDWNSQKENTYIIVSVEVEKPILEMMEILSLGDFVFISKDFAAMCGYNDMVSTANALCSTLRPEAAIICPWGEKGACAKTVDGSIVVSDAYPPEKILTTLGAGDTFVAATIMAILKGKDLAEAINIGCKVAGAKCGMSDTKGLAKLFPFLS